MATAPPTVSSDGAAALVSPVATGTGPSPTTPPPIPDACFAGLDLGPPEAFLPALVAACAPGTEDVAPPRSVELSRGVTELAVSIRETPRCLRVFVVSEAPLVSASMSAPGSGGVVANDSSRAPFLVIDRDGPFCVDEPGDYRIAIESAAPARAHVWVRSPPLGH